MVTIAKTSFPLASCPFRSRINDFVRGKIKPVRMSIDTLSREQ